MNHHHPARRAMHRQLFGLADVLESAAGAVEMLSREPAEEA